MPKEVADIKKVRSHPNGTLCLYLGRGRNTDIASQFIEISRRKDASCMYLPSHVGPAMANAEQGRSVLTCPKTAARIKKNKKTNVVKFKVRCQRYLYTLVLKDSEKAEKLKQSLPPSMQPLVALGTRRE